MNQVDANSQLISLFRKTYTEAKMTYIEKQEFCGTPRFACMHIFKDNPLLKLNQTFQQMPATFQKKQYMYSKIPILRPPFGLPKSGLISKVVLIWNIIS